MWVYGWLRIYVFDLIRDLFNLRDTLELGVIVFFKWEICSFLWNYNCRLITKGQWEDITAETLNNILWLNWVQDLRNKRCIGLKAATWETEANWFNKST